MIDREWAAEFAKEWIAAWNAHDLERILSHYSDDFEMHSPLIAERMGVPEGRLKGKDAIRPYWARGLAAIPDLRFELIGVYLGVSSLAMHYRSFPRNLQVIERIEFDERGRAIRGEALYAPAG